MPVIRLALAQRALLMPVIRLILVHRSYANDHSLLGTWMVPDPVPGSSTTVFVSLPWVATVLASSPCVPSSPGSALPLGLALLLPLLMALRP